MNVAQPVPGKPQAKAVGLAGLPGEEAAFEAPGTRIDGFERLRTAVLSGDTPEVNQVSDWFGSPAPTQVQLATLTRELSQKPTAAVFRRASTVMDHLAGGRFEIVASTLRSENAARRFGDLEDKFVSAGEAMPKLTDGFAYFTSPPSQSIRLRLDLPQGTRTAVFHFIGYVHSGTSDQFFVRFGHGDRNETLRLGANGVTFENERSFIEMRGSFPRLFTIVSTEQSIAIYISGFCVWKKVRGGNGPRQLELILDQNANSSGDGVINAFEVWTTSELVESLFETEGGYDPTEGFAWQLKHSRAAEVARMIDSIQPLDISKYEDDALAFMRRCAESPKGYLEWAVEAIRPRLSASAQAEWQKIKEATLPVPVVEVRNVRVELMRNPAKSMLITNLLLGRGDNFAVLDDVSLTVYPGDVVGIIGHNGAGKSTLLRTLAGLVPIKSGRIRIADKFMLLRGGIGVRMELTGRQNVISAGIYMGLTPDEARELVPDVLEVSGLGEHFERPVKYYSDGMMSRLVFSIATSASPTVLLLDELLGAGDISFQEKAKKRLDSFLGGSNVVVVVTHSIDFVRKSCNKALVLSHGKQIYFGEPKTAVAAYLTDLDMALSKKETEGRF